MDLCVDDPLAPVVKALLGCSTAMAMGRLSILYYVNLLLSVKGNFQEVYLDRSTSLTKRDVRSDFVCQRDPQLKQLPYSYELMQNRRCRPGLLPLTDDLQHAQRALIQDGAAKGEDEVTVDAEGKGLEASDQGMDGRNKTGMETVTDPRNASDQEDQSLMQRRKRGRSPTPRRRRRSRTDEAARRAANRARWLRSAPSRRR